jgi:aspartate-semialdehyde dehydrogenase
MVIQECKPDAPGFAECGVVFSGLDHDVAGEIGECDGPTRHDE